MTEVWLFVLGTQQTEDPRVVWKDQQRNMIKHYVELAQNDLTVSKTALTFLTQKEFWSMPLMTRYINIFITEAWYQIGYSFQWTIRQISDLINNFSLHKYLEFCYNSQLNLKTIINTRCGCNLGGFLSKHLSCHWHIPLLWWLSSCW